MSLLKFMRKMYSVMTAYLINLNIGLSAGGVVSNVLVGRENMNPVCQNKVKKSKSKKKNYFIFIEGSYTM